MPRPAPSAIHPMLDYNDLLRIFEDYLGNLDYQKEPHGLYAPVEYTLSLGGKRLRPVMCLLACQMYGQPAQKALAQAAALEMFHNFTLLHDDLMDRALIRRGKETVHIKWNDNTAVLSGDAMVILSHRLLLSTPEHLLTPALDLFTRTGLEVCEGQQLDMEFESRDDVTEEEYMEMIRLKTSVLLAASLKMGALVAGAPIKQQELIYDLGISMGLAFQLEDDLLDVYGDPSVFGKAIGGDILCGKKTFMLIKARSQAKDELRDSLEKWISSTDSKNEEKIQAVTRIYDALDIRSQAMEKIQTLTDDALKTLDLLDVDESLKSVLRSLVQKLSNRNK